MPHTNPDEEKVIINGGVAAAVIEKTCQTIYRAVEHDHTFENAKKLVLMANELENLAFKFQKEVLKGLGFNGPWPHSMTFEKD